MNLNKNKIINYLISLLIIIEPILEIVYINNDKFEILGFKLTTLIRFVLFGILSLLFLLKFKELKNKKIIIMYIFLVGIYFIMHHLNALSFISYIPGNLNYSLLEEIFYLIRMIIPIFLIYYLYNYEFEEKNFNCSITLVIFIITSIIIISNLFKFSLCSYSDEIISGNIIDWFVNYNGYGYLSLASRGLFSNIIIFYLVLLFLPYLIYLFFENKDFKKYIYGLLIIFSMLSSFMVGTKSTTLGFMIVVCISFLMHIFFSIIKKDFKFSISKNLFIVLIFAVSIFMLDYSPMNNRNITDSNLENDKQLIENEIKETESSVSKDEIIKYLDKKDKDEIEEKEENEVNIDEALDLIKDENVKKILLVDILSKNYQNYGINLRFIEDSYSYKNDPFFWKKFVDTTYYFERSNNRMVVQKVFERILEVNNNSYDKYLGITYSRTSKVFNLERDFLYQYYSMGILGCILLLGPYIFIILFSGIYMLIHFKTKLTFKNCSLLLGIGLILCLAFYSGNTIESLAIIIPLGITCGYLLKKILTKE